MQILKLKFTFVKIFFVVRIKNTIHVERAKANKMSQDDLAKKVNVSRQTIYSIEKGRKLPSVQLAFEIAKVFNTTVDSIFSLEP